MQQKELANLLGVSPAMVSRHAKRGMPTDTLERAQRWRKRHLEPGRVKGARYTPNHDPAPERLPNLPSLPEVLPCVLEVEMEAAGDLIDAALARGNQYGAAIRTWQLRGLLRQATELHDLRPQATADVTPRLSLRVWLALLGYWLHEDAEIRHAPNMGELLTPGELGARVGDGGTPAHLVLFDACDFDDVAINGWPEYPDDET